MGVKRFSAIAGRLHEAARDRIEQAVTRRSDEETPAAANEAAEPVDPVADARRKKERSQFDDNAAYFEFLIERAVADATSEGR